MKKIFTLLVAAISSMSMMAKDYTGTLTVSVDGAETTSQSTISVDENGDKTYNLTLKNFILGSGASQMAIGTIKLTGVETLKTNNDATILKTEQNINIEAGDQEGVTLWMGPMLGQVPVQMLGMIRNDNFRTLIVISFNGMNIVVHFADGFQLPNSGFEDFHEASYTLGTTVTDPFLEANGWHSFPSAAPDNNFFAYCAAAQQHTDKSSDVRPGSTGTNSAKLIATSVYGIIANGTMTTGRMNASSMTATDAKGNYAYCDLSETATDANGDPFYAKMNGIPDSLKVWVKFGQGTPNTAHPYATISAIVTDGTRFQEPAAEGVTYNNVVCEARNPKIEATNGEWKLLSIPFVVKDKSLTPKAILVTISTNADAGQGSANDTILVDDISLVYNYELTSLKYDGKDITFTPGNTNINATYTGTFDISKLEIATNANNSQYFTRVKEYNEETGEVKVALSTIADDLNLGEVYAITFTKSTDGISAAQTAESSNAQTEIYNAAGQSIKNIKHGLNIIKQGDKVVKVIKK